ncbi:hypothetical protein PGT21_037268 [Puccinia graminis f. sp. tritici]|uniref:Uncharacterized protein n=1 Tax=Puccinia graminis f. sp. tritici TaxID=56615 RepID=A0A5B0R3H7_PUCGR|nr:hypothetical protein PGTUg99_016280 [Puccinia graminis f. sp. tritici]KAA1120211.1 hypothetical protein PGT21_037268 [Puccinia graminis f. sp. tritici]
MRFTISSTGFKWERFLLLSQLLLAVSIHSAPIKHTEGQTISKEGMYYPPGAFCTVPCKTH